MNRTILILTGLLSVPSLLLVDSAVKGTALLTVAAIAAMILRRDSAATRHLVWLLAVIAMLAVPVLSAILPQWRVLPEWARIPAATAGAPAIAPSIGMPVVGPAGLVQNARPDAVGSRSVPEHRPDIALPDSPQAMATPQAVPTPAGRSWNWPRVLPLVWAVGFCALILRLIGARWMLWNAGRQGTVVWSPWQSAQPGSDPIATALEAACRQLGMSCRVTLLIHPEKTIPVVWGILRCRLMLPAAARDWGDEQLRSVLLHELAHIKRRDTIAQLLTQIACALHWFNPLVWLAAWRLGVERERACDDLVLASGVRPSAYAGHLLDVVTKFSSVRWAQACGLAMARKSSLEGRLVAVLSKSCNRRGVTTALAAAALVLGAGIAVPLAMLRAAEPDKSNAATKVVNAEPKDEKSRPLFENWKSSARRDGKIPGGRIGEIAASLKTFMELNPGHEQSVKLEPVIKKCDASRDWTPAEAAAMLDEIAAITPQAEWAMRANTEREIHPGKPLPEELANAPWGKPAENGLRMAWLLEPRTPTQALDSVMKSRVLFHNAGKAPVCFATEDWIQTGGHKAKDVNGKDIHVWAISRMGIRLRMNFRLAPGEYAEVAGHGLGVGSHETSTEKSIYKVGCWIEAKEGEAVTFTPGSVLVSFQTWQNNEGRKDSVTVWREMIAARVMQESPMPAVLVDREQLLRRVTKDLLGTEPTPEEIANFVADNAPDALARLIKSLETRAAAMHFAGELSGGETKFRVTVAKTIEKPKPGADASAQPKHEYAQALFKKWQALARTDGKIPGALIGDVGTQVDSFLKQHPAGDQSSKLAALRPRLDASRDWTQAEAVALLNDITDISTAPVSWAELSLTFGGMGNLQAGKPLPAELATAAWGAPAANGLRAAWLLEPRAEQYPLGSVLKARVLFHNSGKAPVVFKTETWHQADPHTARDAKGGEIKVSSTWYSGITPTATYRLAAGEYCEVMGHGIAIGAGEYTEEHSTGSVGAVIEAKEGDDVRLSHSVDATYGGWTRPNDPKDPAELWKKNVAERVARQAPMPQAAADREQLIRRVMLDLFGVGPTAEEIAAFVGDNTPDALAALTARLQAKPRVEPWSDKLPTGETRFRVIAPAPDAAKAPRTAKAPGRYVLADNVHLLVSQTTTDAERTNKAVIAFLSPDPKVASPHKPYEIALPDGINTYGIVWERGAGVLWILQKDLVRSYDFMKPDAVKETRFEQGGILNVPQRLQAAMKQAFDVPEAPKQQQPPKGAKLEIPGAQQVKKVALAGQPDAPAQQPQAGAQLKPATEQKLKWGEPANGLRMALAWPPTLGEPGMGEATEFYLVVQNVSQADVRLTASDAAPNPRRLMLRENGSPLSALVDPGLMPGDWLLQPRGVAFLRLFHAGEKMKDGRTTCAVIEEDIRVFPQYSMTAEMSIEKAPAGAWTGKLATGETRGSVDVIPPKHKDAQALYKSWTTAARRDGKLPGAVIGQLAESVRTFIKNNPTWATTPQLQKMLPRFDASHDWNGQDAVGLLDELTAVQDTPIGMALERENEGIIRTGAPLPPELATAPWGEALPNGLRHAWLLEPRATEHRLGTPLRARALIHNAGKEPVVFRTRMWHQLGHTATDAKGVAIKVDSTEWTTIGWLTTFRLAPGEFIEVIAPGIGVGPMGNSEDWQQTRVGSWIEAKADDEVMVTTGPLPLSDWNDKPEVLAGEPRWWLDHIKARLSRHLPFPADAEARKLLLYRIAMELFGTPVDGETNNAFVADRTPAALDSLAIRLFHRPGLTAWVGPLQSAATKFRVLPADPDAARKPRTANNPGHYTLAANAALVVSRRPVGERIVNEAHISLTGAEPHKLVLPDGYDTWAVAWVRGGTVLWLQQKSGIRSYDFTNSAQVKETSLDAPADLEKVPGPIKDALRAALEVPVAPKPMMDTPKPPASMSK